VIEKMAQQCIAMMDAMGSNMAGMMGNGMMGGMWMMLAWLAVLFLIIAVIVVGAAFVLRIVWRRTA
jgi:hypothetical protein